MCSTGRGSLTGTSVFGSPPDPDGGNMTCRCFHCPTLGEPGELLTLDPKVAHHVVHVVRLKRGDFLDLKDGRGKWCRARVEDAGPASFRVRVVEVLKGNTESPLSIVLCLAFARQDRMDLVVRQATELGVTRLVGFRAQRSQYGLSNLRVEKRRERWERIALEAICQCERRWAPQVEFCEDLHALTARVAAWGGPDALKIVAYEEAMFQLGAEPAANFRDLASSHPTSVIALVGPEGGWAGEEVAYLARAGFVTISLGPRILRFETAALAMLTLSQFLWGDMGTGSLEG